MHTEKESKKSQTLQDVRMNMLAPFVMLNEVKHLARASARLSQALLSPPRR